MHIATWHSERFSRFAIIIAVLPSLETGSIHSKLGSFFVDRPIENRQEELESLSQLEKVLLSTKPEEPEENPLHSTRTSVVRISSRPHPRNRKSTNSPYATYSKSLTLPPGYFQENPPLAQIPLSPEFPFDDFGEPKIMLQSEDPPRIRNLIRLPSTTDVPSIPRYKPLSSRELQLLLQIRSIGHPQWRTYGACQYDWASWKLSHTGVRTTVSVCGKQESLVGVSCSKLMVTRLSSSGWEKWRRPMLSEGLPNSGEDRMLAAVCANI